jgi:hypothetical protein
MSKRSKRANRRVDLHSHSIITYIVVLPNEPEEDTPFQGFAARLLEISGTLRSILRLPVSFVELYLQRDEIVAERAMTGGYQIIPREVSALENLPTYPAVHFMIVISGPGTDELTAARLAKLTFPVLHVSTSRFATIPHLDQLTLEEMRAYCDRAIEFIRKNFGSYSIPELQRPGPQGTITLPLEETGHFVAVPNEAALKSFGYQLAPLKKPISPLTILSTLSRQEADEPHVRRIRESAMILRDVRTTAVAKSSPVPVRTVIDLIVGAPIMFRRSC